MREQWLRLCLDLSYRPATFYASSRKIIRPVTVEFDALKNDLRIEEVGYSKAKMTQLVKNYIHEESRKAAVELWHAKIEKGKFSSVGFHCFNHLLKGQSLRSYWVQHDERVAEGLGLEAPTKHGSLMGPCIQSVVLTLLPTGETEVSIHYRTTEVYKKFPADLVLIRDHLLEPFNLTNVKTYRFHFENVTVHPMYWASVMPLFDDPIRIMKRIKRADPAYHRLMVKWLANYLLDDRTKSIEKFRQAMAVRTSLRKRLLPETLRLTQQYLENHR